MTREEAKEVFLNRGFIGGIYDGNKWRDACIVISEWLKEEPTTKHDPNFVPIILTTANGGKVNAFLYKPQCLIVTGYVTVEYSKSIGWSFKEVNT